MKAKSLKPRTPFICVRGCPGVRWRVTRRTMYPDKVLYCPICLECSLDVRPVKQSSR